MGGAEGRTRKSPLNLACDVFIIVLIKLTMDENVSLVKHSLLVSRLDLDQENSNQLSFQNLSFPCPHSPHPPFLKNLNIA